MALDIERKGADGACTLVVKGEVDLYSSPDLRAAITKAMPKFGGSVSVDLRGIPYMDSSGVATLVEGYRTAMERSTAFILLSPSQSVLKVLQLSRLDTVFTIRNEA